MEAKEVTDENVIGLCSKCYTVLDVDTQQETAYCESCETIVEVEFTTCG